MTFDQIENRRAFLKGITDPDGWVNELCDLARKGLEQRAEVVAPKRYEITAFDNLEHEDPHPELCVTESPKGEWVRWSDMNSSLQGEKK